MNAPFMVHFTGPSERERAEGRLDAPGDRFEAFVRYATVLGLNDWTAQEVSAGIGLRF